MMKWLKRWFQRPAPDPLMEEVVRRTFQTGNRVKAEVDEDGSTVLITQTAIPERMRQLIAAHDRATQIHSVPGPMRKNPAYEKIMKSGEAAIPEILRYLRDVNGGMNIMLLLMDQVKEHPYKPEPVLGGPMAAYTVQDAKEAWLRWGREKGYLD